MYVMMQLDARTGGNEQRRKEKGERGRVYRGNETPQLDGCVPGAERVQLDAGYISNGNSTQDMGKTQRIHEWSRRQR
jgi:hypothetical protein